MEQYMRVIGLMESSIKASALILMEKFMMASGKMGSHLGKELKYGMMEGSMMGCGGMESHMGKERKYTLMGK